MSGVMETMTLILLMFALTVGSGAQQLGPGCGQSLHCIKTPIDCNDQVAGDCQAVASVGVSADRTKALFTLSAKTTTYIALGITASPSMPEADVYACTENNEVVRTWNAGYSNEIETQIGVSDESVSLADGVITCQFSRAVSLSDAGSRFFDLTSANYYLIMSWGGQVLPNGGLTRHTDTFVGSQFDLSTPPQSPPPSATTPRVADQPSPSTTVGTTPSGTGVPGGAEGCGVTMGCFSVPEGCNPDTNCDAFSSWVANPEKTEITIVLQGRTDTYVAMGFSRSGGMDNTEVYACTSRLALLRSRNEGTRNIPIELRGVSGQEVTHTDGILRCNFTRVVSLDDNADGSFFDLSSGNEHTIILVWSGPLQGDGNIAYHAQNRLPSSQAVDVTAIAALGGTNREDETTPGGTGVSGGAEGCGVTMGCFSVPEGCNPDSNCDAFSSWVANPEKTEITIVLQGRTDTYVAMGFSRSGGMDNTEVYACTSRLALLRSRNEGTTNIPIELKGVSGQEVTHTNGILRCTFTRVVSLDDNDGSFFNLSSGNEHTIILVWSGPLQSNGNIDYHGQNRQTSNEPVDVTAIAALEGTTNDGSGGILLRRFHGALMVLAWLCFASIGLTTARYFKDLPGQTCSKPKWFFIHRSAMSGVLICCLVAFILILIAVGGSYPIGGSPTNVVRSLHGIFGFIVVGLCLINVMMALLRPHPGEPRRKLFNWAHWGVGTSAHLLGLFTILAGTANFESQSQIPLFPVLKPYAFWVVVGFVVWHFCLWIIFASYPLFCKPSGERSDDVTLKAVNGTPEESPPPQQEKPSLSPAMIYLCSAYYAVTITTTIVIIILIFI